MTTKLAVIGCGGFGREVLSIVAAINRGRNEFEVIGVVDDAPTDANLAALKDLGVPLLGGSAWIDDADPSISAVIGIASPSVRRDFDARWPTRAWASLVHPDTTVGAGADLAPGVVVAPGARISTAVRLGRHAQIDQGATIGHDTCIADYGRLNPQACVSGNVTVHEEAVVGASATILQGLSIGRASVVGAGAVVVESVPGNKIVKGVPAR